MSIENIEAVLADLGGFFRRELAATQIATTCLRTVAFHVEASASDVQGERDTMILGHGVPGVGWLTTIRDVSAAADLVNQVAEGGEIMQRLTQQLIVTLYTGWEESFRTRIAIAKGRPKAEISAPFFGDLRRLRNDIVHHRGIASRPNSARWLESLDRTLEEGQPIFLTDSELSWLYMRIPFAVLLKS